jgi:hypothetical protein
MVLAVSVLPSVAHANMAPRWWGDRTAEPPGFKAVSISHEKLTIDLRPLAALNPVRVEAIYHISNPGPACKLELFFVAGAPAVQDFEVQLNERSVESRPVKWEAFRPFAEEHPEGWRTYADLPGIDRPAESVFHSPEWDSRPMAFTVELPTGISTLTARYSARACGSEEGYPTATWQFPYFLAPAKRWGSFGRLDVAIDLPAGWEAASAPPLRREGDQLIGSFHGLPADTLVLATRAPVGEEYHQAIQWGWVGIVGGFLVGGVLFCLTASVLGWVFRQLLSGPRRDPAIPWLLIVFVNPIAAFVWPLAFMVGAGAARQRTFDALGGQESPDFSQRCPPMPLLAAFFLAVMIFGVACVLGGFILHRWTTRGTPERHTEGSPTPGTPVQ